MLREKGFVASVSDDGWAKVITHRREACGDCRASHCCSSFGSSSKMVIKALNNAGAGAGDMVSISLKTQALVKSAAIVYMVPVAGLISGAIAGVPLGKEMGMSEGTTCILFSLLGLGLGFMVTVLISRWMSTRGQMTPIITRIIQAGTSAPEPFMAVDPVCKMMFDPSSAPASVIHKDNTYYFCNPGCKEAFLKQPESYL